MHVEEGFLLAGWPNIVVTGTDHCSSQMNYLIAVEFATRYLFYYQATY